MREEKRRKDRADGYCTAQIPTDSLTARAEEEMPSGDRVIS